MSIKKNETNLLPVKQMGIGFAAKLAIKIYCFYCMFGSRSNVHPMPNALHLIIEKLYHCGKKFAIGIIEIIIERNPVQYKQQQLQQQQQQVYGNMPVTS